VHCIFTSTHTQFCPALQMQTGVLITLTAAACIGDLSSKEAIGFITLEANFMGNSACSRNITPLAFHVLGIGARMFFLEKLCEGRLSRLGCKLADGMVGNRLDEVTVCSYSEHLVLLSGTQISLCGFRLREVRKVVGLRRAAIRAYAPQTGPDKYT